MRLLSTKTGRAILIGACFVFLFMLTFTNVVSASSQISFTSEYLLSASWAHASDPNVQATGSHVYVAWSQGDSIKFRSSSNSGGSWSSIITLAASGGSTAQYPLMTDNGSNVYVVWAQVVGLTGLQIIEATSENYGASFRVVQVTTGNATDGFITPVIAAWGDQVYISYDNTTNGYAWLTSSSNAGATWTYPIEADSCPGNGPCPEPQLYAWKNYAYDVSDNGLIQTNNSGVSWNYVNISGNYSWVREPWIWGYGSNVYVVFETGGTGSDTFLTYTNDNGANWTSAVSIFPSVIPDSWNQMVGAYGNESWIAIQQYPGGTNDKMWVTSSTNAGANWSMPKQVSRGGVTSNPFTIATSNGQDVFTAWSQRLSPTHWVMQVAYTTNGGTWSGPYTASNNPTGDAGTNNDVANGDIAASGSTVFVVWQYISGWTSQIYFSKST
jgi:hypothetical protein